MEDVGISHIAAREQTGEGILTGALKKADDLIVSTIADTATSLWNSVIDTPNFFLPESMELDTSGIRLDTYDVLSHINDDYANFYTENQDLVQTASFVAGVMLPGGAALKGMRYLRSGKFAFMPEFVSTEKATKDLSILRQMVADGKQATQEFRDLRRNMYVRMAAGEGIDAIGTEAAIVGLLSDHPFMEDYMKDPWTNFATWAGVGGVLGSGLGAISKNYEIRTTLGEVYSAAQSIVTDPKILQRVDIPTLPQADLARRNFYNADVLKKISEDSTQNQLTRDLASRFALSYESTGQKILLDALSKDVKNAEGLSKEAQEVLTKKTQELIKSSGAIGVDKVEFMPIQNVTGIAKKQSVIPEADIELQETLIERFGKTSRFTANSKELAAWAPDYAKMLEKNATDTYVGYSPVFGAYVPRQMSWALQTAADLGEDLKHIDVVTPFKDTEQLYLRQGIFSNPAYASKRYLDALNSVMKMNLEQLPQNIKIHKDDLPVMNAWLARSSDLVSSGKDAHIQIVGDSGKIVQEGSIDILTETLSRAKERQIQEFTKVGASIHEIATRVDVDSRVVESYLFENAQIQNFDSWRKTTDPTKLKEYMAPDKRMLKLSVDPKKRLYASDVTVTGTQVGLDHKALDNYHKQVMEEMVTREGSKSARAIYDALNQDKTFWDIVRQRIGEISQESVGGMFFASADQGLRLLKDLGTVISQNSKQVFGIGNKTFEATHTQLSLLTKQIYDNELFTREFQEIANTLAGTPGYVFMKEDGAFWVREAAVDEMGKRLRNQDGTLATQERMLMKSDGSQLKAEFTVVRNWMKEMKNVGEEHLRTGNTIRGIQGANPINDRGLWIPSYNPINKYISYVIDPTAPVGAQTKTLLGNSPEHLASLEQAWKAGEGKNNPHMKLITKSEQADYNKLQNILDPIEMDYADIALRHGGASQQAITPNGREILSTVMENLHARHLNNTRKMVSLYLSDIMSQLDLMSLANQKYTKAQPARGITKILNYSEDSAAKVKSILLGESTNAQYQTWQVFNNATKTLIERGISDVSKIFQRHIDFDKLGNMTKKDFIKLSQDMERAGVANPFKVYDEYLAARNAGQVQQTKELDSLYAQYLKGKQQGKKTSADALVAAGNGIIATIALRVADLAHPLVNALSLPILSNASLMARMPETFMGIKAGPEATGGVVFATRAMMDGVRARFNPITAGVLEEFRKEGLVKPIVSEATDMMRLIHSGEKNAAAQINKILDSDLVNFVSKPADIVESETRAISLMTGYMAAKRAYPGISHEGAKLYAKQFMDRTIGNYYSFQRPVMFQGTFGVAIGLFQTYMMTMAQSIYRNIEQRQFKALAGSMLTQAGMFGMSSLPFYDLTSKFIGEHMSDDHYDITTGTYRALPNPLAEFILYGLPSNMGSIIGSTLGIDPLKHGKGVALYTRGDLQPRLPFITSNPAEQLVAVNALMQAYSSVGHVITKVKNAEGAMQIGQALAEGLSMQSLSRPVARGAELISGYSVNQLGNTVQGPEDVWSVTGITSRLLASRTTEEQIKRHADHLNSYYGALDYENRRNAVEAIKQAIRAQNLNDEVLSKIAYKYMRTGTPTGWKSALNEAIAGTSGGIDYKFLKVLRPDSPLNKMVSEL